MLGCANSTTQARKTTYAEYAIATVGTSAASRLAEQELLARDRRRKDRLEAALLPLAGDGVGGEHRGVSTGIASMYRIMCMSASEAAVTLGTSRTTHSGWMRKMRGKIAVATTTWPWRRYSRSSLRTMAPTRLGLILIAAPVPARRR